MKQPLHLFVSLTIYTLISLSLFGQKGNNKDSKIPAFGNAEKTDLEVKECDFDKNAEVMVLFDKGQLDYILGLGHRSCPVKAKTGL